MIFGLGLESLQGLEHLADRLSVVLVLIIVIVGTILRWWVPGWLYDATVKDRDLWRDLTIKQLTVTGRAIVVADKMKDAS